MQAIAAVGDDALRIAAVDRIAGEAGRVAEILAARCRNSGNARTYARATARPRDRPARNPSRRRRAAATVPTISCPGISGSFGWSSSPSTTCRSVRHTPHAWTSISNWPVPATGSRHIELRAARASVPSKTIARMMYVPFRQGLKALGHFALLHRGGPRPQSEQAACWGVASALVQPCTASCGQERCDSCCTRRHSPEHKQFSGTCIPMRESTRGRHTGNGIVWT